MSPIHEIELRLRILSQPNPSRSHLPPWTVGLNRRVDESASQIRRDSRLQTLLSAGEQRTLRDCRAWG
jgi:hypothetical protein